VLGDLGQLVAQRVEDPVELGVHAGGVGLVIDRVQQTHGQLLFGVAAIRLAA